MRKARAAKLVEEQVDGVSVSARGADDEAVVRLDEDGTRVATIVGEESPASTSPRIRLEYVTDGPTRVRQKAARVRRLLSRRAR